MRISDWSSDVCSSDLHLLLDLQPPGIGLDDAGKLADADDPLIRQIGNMRLADDRDHVVLAMRNEADVAQHDHLVVAVGLLEGALQNLDWVDFVAREELLEGADNPCGRLDRKSTRLNSS